MSQQGQHDLVRFNTTGTAIAGALAGVAIALGFPWVILVHGQVLGAHVQVILVWVGIAVGGTISLTSAFFGLVLPSGVGPPPWDQMLKWEQERKRSERPAEAAGGAPSKKETP